MIDSLTAHAFDQTVTEIKGRPGLVWGNLIVPTGNRSKINIKLTDEFLHTRIRLAYGLEKKDIQTPLQDIGSIEIAEGRLWWLLWLGVATLWLLVGVIFIFLFFIIKQRWIVIYTSNVNLIAFYRKTENIEQFRTTLFTAVHQARASKTLQESYPTSTNRVSPNSPPQIY